jgi:hypothetical protein
VICSKCGMTVAADAGFCRGCSAIFRGKGINAFIIPARTANGPVPVASSPEPRTPALANADYSAPPASMGAQSPPYSPQRSQDVQPRPPYSPPRPSHALPLTYASPRPDTQSEPDVRPQPDAQAEPHARQDAQPAFNLGSSAAAPAAPPIETGPREDWFSQGPRPDPFWDLESQHSELAGVSGAVVASGKRLQLGDFAAAVGVMIVLISLSLPWYQVAIRTGGVTLHLPSVSVLNGQAGGWRWLILVVSVGTLVELVVTWLVYRKVPDANWPHRVMLIVLCALTLVLAVAALLVFPFNVATVAGAASSVGTGAFVGVIGAVVATVASTLAFRTTSRAA